MTIKTLYALVERDDKNEFVVMFGKGNSQGLNLQVVDVNLDAVKDYMAKLQSEAPDKKLEIAIFHRWYVN